MSSIPDTLPALHEVSHRPLALTPQSAFQQNPAVQPWPLPDDQAYRPAPASARSLLHTQSLPQPPQPARPDTPAASLALLSEPPVPTRLLIPTLGVDAQVVPIGLNRQTGELALLPDVHVVQWYRLGPAPGQPGAAVLAGHLDGIAGEPGVFARLAAATPGTPVIVLTATGQRLQFRVTRLWRVPADELFQKSGYTTAGSPRVLLITCTGRWDLRLQRYTENLVVEAAAVPD